MYQGVFFDFYGTLLIYHDTPAAWADWLTACYENLRAGGLLISREEFARHFDGLFSRPEPPAGHDGLTVYERRIKSMVSELYPGIKDRDIRRAATASAAAWQKHITLDRETIPLLASLKSSKTLALISNFDHPPHVYSLLDELNLSGYFATVLVSGETGYKKPHTHMFLQALAQTGLTPAEVVYVGDTADDMTGACAAGLRPILIRREGAEQSAMMADFRYRRPLELPKDNLPIINNVTVISSLAKITEILA